METFTLLSGGDMNRNRSLFVAAMLIGLVTGQLLSIRTAVAQVPNQTLYAQSGMALNGNRDGIPTSQRRQQLRDGDTSAIFDLNQNQLIRLLEPISLDSLKVKTAGDLCTLSSVSRSAGANKSRAAQTGNNCPRCLSSGIAPNDCNDATFVVDCGGGLDTGCTFRNSGPLNITLKVGRVAGDIAKLKAAGAIKATATLKMPAFDVDYFGGGGQFNPERDRISFNGNVVPGEFLQGDNNVWRLNEFEIPIEWINFPSDPGPGGTVTPVDNFIRIDIDTANSEEVWCVAIDWVELKIEIARPVVMAHGILSSGSTWSGQWVPGLGQLGVPNTNELNMGNLDSIGNNANKISNVVDASKQRWGVDKVVIVAHSKGGLDSREYVENSDSVEQVIQLGTPNAGSPLADRIQSILIRGGARFGVIGALAPVLVQTFAAPAGLQLTTPYMAIYNATHGSNPNVRYTALAGDYDPDCFVLNPFCRPLDRLLLAITGRGDTIVPISSVYALPYTQNKPPFASSGANGQAKHTSLTGSSGVFNAVRDRVTVFGLNRASALAGTPTLAQTSSIVESIQQNQTRTHTIPIDQNGPTFISLMHPTGNLDMALISPSGQRFDAVTVIGNPNVKRDDGSYLGGLIEVYEFAAPEVGIWTVEVTAPSVVEPSGTVGYAVSGWIENPAITLTASLARSSVRMGESLRLFGTLKHNNSPLTGATVKAQVGLPNNSVSEIMLRDDGANGDAAANDGVYTGDFTNTVQPGNYGIAFIAERSASGGMPAFSREDFALATVSRSSSTIVGPFRDFGVDTDGDTFFNNLTIEAGVNITVAGTYRVFGTLTDANGNEQSFSAKMALSPGINAVALKFDGETIFNNRLNGPYQLSVLRLAEEDNLTLAIVDERNNAHQTAAYNFRSFQHTPIFLTGTGSAVGRDTNSNSRFDFLDVTVGVEVRRSGFYQWSARLTDSNGREIDFVAGSRSFGVGANNMAFSFDGRDIGRNGVNGPYFVKGLLIFGAGDSLIVSDAFTTGPFLASQFEGFVADTTPPTLEVSVSPSILSPPNHRLVTIGASVTAQDNLDPNPTVELVSITANEPVNGKGDGNTESDIEDAAFGTDDREFTLRAERSGTGKGRIYTITYRARDAAGNATLATATVTVPHDNR